MRQWMRGNFIRGRIATGVLASVIGTGSTVWAETLTESLVLAYDNSGLLEQNRALLRAADEDVAAAAAAVRPVFAYFANSSYALREPRPGADQLTANAGLTAELTMFDFGRNRLAIDAARETVLSAREHLASVEQRILRDAVSAYMAVRSETEFARLRENSVNVIRQELQEARDRFDVGEVTRTDVALAESRLASARARLAGAEGSLARAKERYRATIGQYPGELSPPPAIPPTAASLEEAQAMAKRNHPDILRAQHDVAAAELNRLRAATNLRPTVSLTGRSSLDHEGTSSTSIGVEMSGVIYRGGQLRALERRAAAQRDSARAALLLTSQQVVRNAGDTWTNLTVANSNITAIDRQVEAARIAYEGTREEASVGSRTTLDVLDAEQELLSAQANRVSAETDAQVAAYNLLAAMGHLTVRHLDLGIATYDPAAYYDAVRSDPSQAVSEQGERLDSLLKRLGYEEDTGDVSR